MRKLLLIAATAFLCSCASSSKAPNVNLAGYPPAFREGYMDGCQSAGNALDKKDAQRFKRDSQYASGWRDGFDICGKQDK